MNCPTCRRKLADNAKVCPSCQHDFVADRRQQALANAIFALLVALAVSLIGLILLSPGIIINSARGRYKNRYRGLISSAVRDWQTWIISLPFAIPAVIFSVNTWNEVSARRAAEETRLNRIVAESQTETVRLFEVQLPVDPALLPAPVKMVITDVSAKFRYERNSGDYSTDSSYPPPIVYFREMPAFSGTTANTIKEKYQIDFSGLYSVRFSTAAQRDTAMQALEKAATEWKKKFPDALGTKNRNTPRQQQQDVPKIQTRELVESPYPEIPRGIPTGRNSGSPSPSAPQILVPNKKNVYSVSGVTKGDSLNVRNGPGSTNTVTAKLPNGFSGIYVSGMPVMNDTTEWVYITFGDQSGWVGKEYLKEEFPQTKNLRIR